jgi:hypothetical protein
MLILLFNIALAGLFWSACTIAAEEGRPGWAWVYLIVSAWNGAAALSTIF